jgi:hypothetical protein
MVPMCCCAGNFFYSSSFPDKIHKLKIQTTIQDQILIWYSIALPTFIPVLDALALPLLKIIASAHDLYIDVTVWNFHRGKKGMTSII